MPDPEIAPRSCKLPASKAFMSNNQDFETISVPLRP